MSHKYRYTLVGNGEAVNYFSINERSGVIKTKTDLNDDDLDEYTFEVVTYSEGNEDLQSTAQPEASGSWKRLKNSYPMELTAA